MGCSNPHPHSQVWSLTTVPDIPSKELSSLYNYASSTHPRSGVPTGPAGHACMLCEYVHHELTVPEDQGRIVTKNEHFVALVPWWAYWPFEIMGLLLIGTRIVNISEPNISVLPYKRHVPSLVHLNAGEKHAFADIMSRVTKRYDNLFSCSFAYAMGIHQRPLPPFRDDEGVYVEDADDIAHLHVHFEPPLLRNASVRKFMAGYVRHNLLICGCTLISSIDSKLWQSCRGILLPSKLPEC